MTNVDVIVVGSGAAGLVAAEEAAKHGLNVVLLTKGQVGRSGATATITGDISVDGKTIRNYLGLRGNEGDSDRDFYDDTMTGGAYLNQSALVQSMISHVGEELKPLLEAGLKVAGIGHAPGHRFPRGVLISGMQLLQILTRRAVAAGARFRDEFYVTDVLRNADGVTGIAGIDLRTGEAHSLAAKTVILATGGSAMIHPFRTAPEELVGDGYRMALRAGAELIDMEMVQFLPCCLVNPPLWRGIQFPWIIGPQSSTRAWLLNRYGERFMARYDPERMEMSTRDKISIACVREVQEGRGGPGGGVFMSWAHLPHDILEFLPKWYGKPLLRETWHWEGFDFRPLIERIKQGYAVEVAPASHFNMGGVRIDAECGTAVPGLLACGEIAGGVHGANRLSGNACSQFLVQGRIAGRSAAQFASSAPMPEIDAADWKEKLAEVEAPLLASDGVQPHTLASQIQDIANRTLNVVRNGSNMAQGLREIRALRAGEVTRMFSASKDRRYNRNWIDAQEVQSAALTVEAIAMSAVIREESRGAHYRDDFREQKPEFHHNTVVSLKEGTLQTRRVAVAGNETK
ncbi:MAG: FAD-binding protein [Xanthobacteraceae bacterium]|nr:FAD-binding protein [Xanthobacteraceae bacterium]MCW5678185.1 FAD-binding protein [Xanthobacteraceae bacterium]